jgi:hypothetical protein
MKRIKSILVFISLGLSVLNSSGQSIGNYVNNGSFEGPLLPNPSIPPYHIVAKYWDDIDTATWTFLTLSSISTITTAPMYGYNYSRTGKNHLGCVMYCDYCNATPFNHRSYPRNRLKTTLQANKEYCVKYYVNAWNTNPASIDRLGAYFADITLDTIYYCSVPLTYLSPQIESPAGTFFTDTVNWQKVSGTFTATGNEKYMVIGNFRSTVGTNTLQNFPNGFYHSEYNVDDVSVIEVNLPAYAGNDTIILTGDSAFIGRQPDFAIDPGCMWYKLPNTTTAIDTISGLWVKPVITSTYVVRQELECSALKWDTVVVFVSAVGLEEFKQLSENINLFPNPTSNNLFISIPNSFTQDLKGLYITNSLGQIIREQDFNSKSNSFSIKTSDISSGLYQIHFKTTIGTVTKKFIKTD